MPNFASKFIDRAFDTIDRLRGVNLHSQGISYL